MNSASDPTLTSRTYRVVFDELKAVAVRLGANDRLVQDAMNAVEDWIEKGADSHEVNHFRAILDLAYYGPPVAGGPRMECSLPPHKKLCVEALDALCWGDVNEAIEKVEAMQALAAQPPTPPKEAN